MKKRKQVFHPSNPFIYFMLFLSSAFLIPALYLFSILINNTLNGLTSDSGLYLSIPAAAMGGFSFYFFFQARMIFQDDALEIVSFNDQPEKFVYPYTSFFNQIKHDIIAYKDLRFFGSYLASDVEQYLYRGKGQLAVDIQKFEHDGERFSARLGKLVTGFRSVLVFLDDQNGFTVVDAEHYGHRQTQRLLYELTHRTGLIESGHVEANFTWNNMWADAFLALMVLLWILVVPGLIAYIPLLINPLANLKDLGPITWILLFFGNIASLGILEGLKFKKPQRSQKSFKLGMIAFSSITVLAYIGAAIALYFAIK